MTSGAGMAAAMRRIAIVLTRAVSICLRARSLGVVGVFLTTLGVVFAFGRTIPLAGSLTPREPTRCGVLRFTGFLLGRLGLGYVWIASKGHRFTSRAA